MEEQSTRIHALSLAQARSSSFQSVFPSTSVCECLGSNRRFLQTFFLPFLYKDVTLALVSWLRRSDSPPAQTTIDIGSSIPKGSGARERGNVRESRNPLKQGA